MFKTACIFLAYVASSAPVEIIFTEDEDMINNRDGLLKYSEHHVPGQTRWYHWTKGQILWALLGLAVLVGALAYCCGRRQNRADERPVVYVQPQTRVTAPAAVPIQTVGQAIPAVRGDVVNYV